jgi:hypothetical protein
MKKALFAVFLVVLASRSVAASDDSWPLVHRDENATTRVIPSSLERHGQVMVFATSQLYDSPFRAFNWRVAHCTKGWISDAVASALVDDSGPEKSYSEALNKPDLLSVFAVEFIRLADVPQLNTPAFKRILADQCKKPASTQGGTLVPMVSSAMTVEKSGFVDYLMLRTLVRRGDVVEGWVHRSEVKKERMKNPDGSTYLNKDGKPFEFVRRTDYQTMAKFKVSVKCADRMTAITRLTKYAKDGEVTSSSDDNKPDWIDPIPGSIAEGHLDSMCQF